MTTTPISQSSRMASAAAALIQRADLARLDEEDLRAAIEVILPLQVQSIRLAEQTIRWYKAADPDSLLEEAVTSVEQSAADIDPFWAADWRAAFGLDQFMATLDMQDVRVLELGAGSGRAGIAAALRGAQVTITDTVDLAMLVARLNSLIVRQRVSIERLRWAEQRLPHPAYPIILSSDLVYDPNHFPQLEQCARMHLAAGGQWLLSEPQRHTGDRFAQWIVEAGWNLKIHLLDMRDSRIAMRVFQCSLL
ncbi:MAG: SAM-dependent methyltransferase [Pirellulaceae bacterium]|nr:SAM-dependent methyltransferase [Pirellulaceae bacterium]